MNKEMESLIEIMLEKHKVSSNHQVAWKYTRQEVFPNDFPTEISCYHWLLDRQFIKEIDKERKITMLQPLGEEFTTFDAQRIKDAANNQIVADKLWYETENARNQFNSYPMTRMIAISAAVISGLLLLLELIKWITSLK